MISGGLEVCFVMTFQHNMPGNMDDRPIGT